MATATETKKRNGTTSDIRGHEELAVRSPDQVQGGDEVDTLFAGLPDEDQAQPPGMDSLTRAEIDVQIATARRYPRNVKKALTAALSMATLDLDTAESCFYSLPRSGKQLEGPSVRLAEIMAACWGNLRFGARIVDEGDKFITALGMCHDLENNVALGAEVRRRITNKRGERLNDDMIGVTGMAAQSIALRNAVFRIVPRTYVNAIWKQAQKVAVGDQKTLDERRHRAIQWYAKAGVSAERVLAKVGKASLEEVDLEALSILVGISGAIRDGQTTVDAEFPAPGSTPAPTRGAEGLAAAAAKAKAASSPAAPASAPPAPAPAQRCVAPDCPELAVTGSPCCSIHSQVDPTVIAEWMGAARKATKGNGKKAPAAAPAAEPTQDELDAQQAREAEAADQVR